MEQLKKKKKLYIPFNVIFTNFLMLRDLHCPTSYNKVRAINTRKSLARWRRAKQVSHSRLLNGAGLTVI